jgi:hypothetical protein
MINDFSEALKRNDFTGNCGEVVMILGLILIDNLSNFGIIRSIHVLFLFNWSQKMQFNYFLKSIENKSRHIVFHILKYRIDFM